MSTKVCPTCHENQSIDAFHLCRNRPDGHKSECKACVKKKSRARYLRRRDHINAVNKRYREQNHERCERVRLAYEARPEVNCRRNDLKRARRKSKPEKTYPLSLNRCIRGAISGRIWAAMRGITKTSRTLELLGCSIEEFKAHLEAQFESGMTWQNHGAYRVGGPPKWHIDHIVPCAAFNLTDPENQRKCFHWTNCRPLWADQNHRKCDKIEFDGEWIRASMLNRRD